MTAAFCHICLQFGSHLTPRYDSEPADFCKNIQRAQLEKINSCDLGHLSLHWCDGPGMIHIPSLKRRWFERSRIIYLHVTGQYPCYHAYDR